MVNTILNITLSSSYLKEPLYLLRRFPLLHCGSSSLGNRPVPSGAVRSAVWLCELLLRLPRVAVNALPLSSLLPDKSILGLPGASDSVGNNRLFFAMHMMSTHILF